MKLYIRDCGQWKAKRYEGKAGCPDSMDLKCCAHLYRHSHMACIHITFIGILYSHMACICIPVNFIDDQSASSHTPTPSHMYTYFQNFHGSLKTSSKYLSMQLIQGAALCSLKQTQVRSLFYHFQLLASGEHTGIRILCSLNATTIVLHHAHRHRQNVHHRCTAVHFERRL